MAFYSAKNVDLLLNNTGYYVSNANIRVGTSLDPVHKIGSSATQDYSPSIGVEGSLNFNYYLTGVDPIKEYMSREDPISGNFCGLYFNSGYLTSYSISAAAYGPVAVDATLNFYEEAKGAFATRTSSLPDKEVLMFSNLQFNETGIINEKNLLSLDFSYSNSINAYYSVQESGETVTPSSITRAERSTTLDVSTNNLTLNLPPTGLEGTARIILKDSLGVEKESYNISGRINSNEVGAQHGDLISKRLSMSQSNLAMPPSISGMTPTSGPTGTLVRMSGSNFDYVESVRLVDQYLDFEAYPPTGIHFNIPVDGLSGPIEIATKGGKSLPSNAITITAS